MASPIHCPHRSQRYLININLILSLLRLKPINGSKWAQSELQPPSLCHRQQDPGPVCLSNVTSQHPPPPRSGAWALCQLPQYANAFLLTSPVLTRHKMMRFGVGRSYRSYFKTGACKNISSSHAQQNNSERTTDTDINMKMNSSNVQGTREQIYATSFVISGNFWYQWFYIFIADYIIFLTFPVIYGLPLYKAEKVLPVLKAECLEQKSEGKR